MKDYSEILISLLGKSESDPIFQEFLNGIEEVPDIFYSTDIRTEYAFHKSGLILTYFKAADCFASIWINGIDDPTNNKYAFKGRLPGNVEFGDDRTSVHMKLGLHPNSHIMGDSMCDEFHFAGIVLAFYFDQVSGRCTSARAAYPGVWGMPACPI